MYTVVAFFKKREGLTREEFIDYYENHHAPLIMSLAPYPPAVYRRHYFDRDTSDPGGFDFDVMTEAGFPTKEEFDGWFTALTLDVIDEDELKFMDPASCGSNVRTYGLETRVSTEPGA